MRGTESRGADHWSTADPKASTPGPSRRANTPVETEGGEKGYTAGRLHSQRANRATFSSALPQHSTAGSVKSSHHRRSRGAFGESVTSLSGCSQQSRKKHKRGCKSAAPASSSPERPEHDAARGERTLTPRTNRTHRVTHLSVRTQARTHT